MYGSGHMSYFFLSLKTLPIIINIIDVFENWREKTIVIRISSKEKTTITFIFDASPSKVNEWRDKLNKKKYLSNTAPMFVNKTKMNLCSWLASKCCALENVMREWRRPTFFPLLHFNTRTIYANVSRDTLPKPYIHSARLHSVFFFVLFFNLLKVHFQISKVEKSNQGKNTFRTNKQTNKNINGGIGAQNCTFGKIVSIFLKSVETFFPLLLTTLLLRC